MSNVSKKLKAELITKPKRTVTELADMLGMARPSVSNVINGNADLSLELAIKIELKFGLNGRKLLIEQMDEYLSATRAQLTGKGNGY